MVVQPAAARSHPWRQLRRRARLLLRMLEARIGLSQRFLAVAVLVVATAMLALGTLVSQLAVRSITAGVAETLATSIDAIVAGEFAEESQTLRNTVNLDWYFGSRPVVGATQLIDVQIHGRDGSLLYDAAGTLVDADKAGAIAAAWQNAVSGSIVELPLAPVGPAGEQTVPVLRIAAPLHAAASGDVFAVAMLYYTADPIIAMRSRIQFAVWGVVLGTGILVVAALYVFVATTSTTIGRQRRRLAKNLATSRALAEEVRALHAASERLRTGAIEANEQLLARVGSDIHDGPLQLLTLAILQLTSPSRNGQGALRTLPEATALTTQAVGELRSISAGLILPALDGLTIAETIETAIRRHEGATGTLVRRHIAHVDVKAPPSVQMCAYRVVQEALTNAFRHAAGLDQSVRATREGDELLIDIANARAAAGGERPTATPRLGVRGMQLRVEAAGGSLGLAMARDSVEVRVRLPLQRSA